MHVCMTDISINRGTFCAVGEKKAFFQRAVDIQLTPNILNAQNKIFADYHAIKYEPVSIKIKYRSKSSYKCGKYEIISPGRR